MVGGGVEEEVFEGVGEEWVVVVVVGGLWRWPDLKAA